MTGRLHVALAFDDGFWAPAYAAARSVCIATTRRADLVFHLLEWQVSAAHRAELDGLVAEYGAQVVHYPLEGDPTLRDLTAALPRSRAFPPIVYGRLLLDRLLPPEVERLVYLDADVLVRAPIEVLLGSDLGGRALGAVAEPGRHRLIAGDDMRARRGPFDPAEPYFNSGVLLIDRAGWAAADLPGLLGRLVASGEIATLYHDQDVLNLAFRGAWTELGFRWNLQKPHPALKALDPFIVHYTTGFKPWRLLNYVAFGSTYRHVMTRDLVRRYRRYRWARRFAELRRRLFGPGSGRP